MSAGIIHLMKLQYIEMVLVCPIVWVLLYHVDLIFEVIPLDERNCGKIILEGEKSIDYRGRWLYRVSFD